MLGIDSTINGLKERLAIPSFIRRWTLPKLSLVAVIAIVLTGWTVAGRWSSYDVFWHLQGGRDLARGISIDVDRWSWSAGGAPVLDFYAYTDRLFYLIWQAASANGLGLFSSLTTSLLLLPLALHLARLDLHPLFEFAAFFIVIMAVLPYLGARTAIPGILAFAWMIYLLERPFGIAKAVGTAVLLGLWQSLHASFMVGVGLMLAAIVVWVIIGDRRSAAMAGLVLLAPVLATPLNSLGLRIWSWPFQQVSGAYSAPYNIDWSSLKPLNPAFAGMALLVLIAAAVGIWRSQDPRALAALGLLLPTIQTARYTPFLAPLLALVAWQRLATHGPPFTLRHEHPLWQVTSTRRANVVSWLLLLAGLFLPLLVSRSMDDPVGFAQPLPTAAVSRLLACAPPAPVWNEVNWGGYLIWRGDGRYKVGMDDRLEVVYPKSVLDEYLAVITQHEGWRETVQKSPAQYLLMPTDTVLGAQGLPGWRQEYVDKTASLWIRAGATWHCP